MIYFYVYDGFKYYYIRNILGNILGIVDTDGNIIVEYQYDAWGRILSTTGSLASTLEVHNPFRYKGYYYDFETGLYSCNSRYYNPDWGRWLSADDINNLDLKSIILLYQKKATTVLGHISGYITAAKLIGSGYYLVSNGVYDKMIQRGVE
jgi:RHS repeat-associated protein